MAEERSCGDCRLCCKLVPIWEQGTREGERYDFQKRAQVWCQHAGEGGCAIWDRPEKPWACRSFLCLWRQGYGEPETRPDRIGVVMTLEWSHDSRFGQDGLALQMYENRAGAALEAAGPTLVEVLYRHPLRGLLRFVQVTPPELRRARRRVYTADLLRCLVDRSLSVDPSTAAEPYDADADREGVARLLGIDVDAPSISTADLVKVDQHSIDSAPPAVQGAAQRGVSGAHAAGIVKQWMSFERDQLGGGRRNGS